MHTPTPPSTLSSPPLICVTGGIGSGKSVVCKILSSIGLPVYDCDSRAKALMDGDTAIHRELADFFGPEVVFDGCINRPLLASIVFADKAKLHRLNAIVHSAVRDDLRRWRTRHTDAPLLFVETAIMLESNLHHQVDAVWLVDAPRDLRLKRACRRDNTSAETITARMQMQTIPAAEALDIPLHIITNDGTSPLLPQIFNLMQPRGITPRYAHQWKR